MVDYFRVTSSSASDFRFLWLWSDVRRESQSEEYVQKLTDMLRDEKT